MTQSKAHRQAQIPCYATCQVSLSATCLKNPSVALQQAKQLADDIREWVKALGFERHKLVIQVL